MCLLRQKAYKKPLDIERSTLGYPIWVLHMMLMTVTEKFAYWSSEWWSLRVISSLYYVEDLASEK